MGPLAVLTCAALVLTALRPDLAVSLAIFSLSALFGIYQITGGHRLLARVRTNGAPRPSASPARE